MLKFEEALEVARTGLNLAPENEDFLQMVDWMNQEIEADSTVPKDHPIRKKFLDLLDHMQEYGAKFPKLRLRFYESTHRGVHAACDVKLGDILLFVPHDQIITIDDACETPCGAIMKEAGYLDDEDTFNFQLMNFMAVYVLTEIYKIRADPEYVSKFQRWLNIIPEDVLDFPVMYDEDMIAELEGSEIVKTIR